VDIKGPDGTTEFQKNIDGVTDVLAQVPAGARITIIGITDRSFAQPYILLSATVPDDPGYFGERLSTARRELAQVWKQRSAKLEPKFPGTDILGALELASQMFSQYPSGGEHRMLVIFSDMRNHTQELNLDSRNVLSVAQMQHVTRERPDLRNVQVFALGIDGAGSTTEEWSKRKEFWCEYFERTGAMLRTFSVLREAPLLIKK
jgi:hypothetical protein